MKYNVIGSSSKGNAIIVEDILLLDCGVSYSNLKEYLKKIKIIFISHRHKDHLNIRAINKIRYYYPNMKFVCGSEDIVTLLLTVGFVSPKNIFMLNNTNWYDFGLLKIKLEPVTHDVYNHCIHFEINKQKGIYIVDTENADNINAEKYDLYLIEANYKEEILKQHLLTCSDEERVYLERVPNTHLSYEQANDFLIRNGILDSVCEYQYIHQSDYNFMED